MSGALIFQLILLVLVFIAWAWLLLRTISVARSRGGIGAWLRSAEDRKDRNTFLFLTVVLAIMLASQLALPSA